MMKLIFKLTFRSATIFLTAVILLFAGVLSEISTCTAQDTYRDSWQQPEMVMDTLGIKSGMIIGEAGAGRGYFTFKLAERVGETGKIYANDISRSSLNYLRNRWWTGGAELCLFSDQTRLSNDPV